jgi:hypothetical protein
VMQRVVDLEADPAPGKLPRLLLSALRG